MSFVVQCDFLQLASYLLSLIVLFYYSALYVIGTIDQKSKAMSRVVRFSDSLALPRASGLGNLTRVLQAKCLAHVEKQCSPLLIYFVCARTTFIF